MVPEIIITTVMMVLCLAVGALSFSIGKKKGAKELLSLFMVNGYELRTRVFRGINQQVKKGGVVFVGDSITQDYPVGEYFPQALVYNRGIGGDTSKGLLGRLNESVFDLDPSVMILLIGTNDLELIGDGVPAIADRIKEIIRLVREKCPKTRIILESVYPVNPAIDPITVSHRQNEDIRQLNDLLKTIPDITFLDFTTLLVDDGGALSRSLSADGLHVNQEGYYLISAKLREIVPELGDPSAKEKAE
jgi:lysophospholipase L1-like esterase